MHSFKPRTLALPIKKAMRTFPAIVVTGPRQSGKTTLLKSLLEKTHTFLSLEDPDIRTLARDDPRGFFERYHPPLILDEIQYVPELLSYIKTAIDEDRRPGQWIITGSQNFLLMKGITQSLAGRAAIFSLLPFSYAEQLGRGNKTEKPLTWLRMLAKTPPSSTVRKDSIEEWILRGNYPEIALHKKIDRKIWCASYIATYLERDVRNLTAVGDLNQFDRFLTMCATRTGQLLNYSDIAKDIGISVTTVKRWISILEASYQIYLLYPYYKNIGKRLIKTPKLYFADTALASYLLGIHDRETLLGSPHFGNLFETAIINDVAKRFTHFGEKPSLFFLRTHTKDEIDLVVEYVTKIWLFEIKSSATITQKHSEPLVRFIADIPPRSFANAYLISRSPHRITLSSHITFRHWTDIT